MSDGDLYGEPTEARDQRRRALITFVVVVLMMFFAVWYALSYINADDARREARGAGTSSTPSCALDASKVTVNVYNGTSREGLAATVGKDLKERGFVVKNIANDPKQATVTGIGQLRFSAAGAKNAEVVKAHLPGMSEKRDKRKWSTVDIVLGPKFSSLRDSSKIVGAC